MAYGAAEYGLHLTDDGEQAAQIGPHEDEPPVHGDRDEAVRLQELLGEELVRARAPRMVVIAT